MYWNKKSLDKKEVEKIVAEFKINIILAELMCHRNLLSHEDAKKYFNPSWEQTHSASLMKDMGKAVDLICKAMSSQQKILIYGDYDVDGTTSVALVHRLLEPIHPNIDFYIPDRYKEGYGLSKNGVDYAIENNCQIMILLDCGIKAVELVQYARDNHIAIIICDHHNPGEELPKANAILNPKQKDCSYPFKGLSGCGVGFKMMQALYDFLDLDSESIKNQLDILAVSIASDLVPMIGENRVLMSLGLKKLSENPSSGLKFLLDSYLFGAKAQKRKITVEDVVFVIGPRINAAGRLKDAKDSVRLLLASEEEAAYFGQSINELNTTRKSLDKDITADALEQLNQDVKFKNKFTTVIHGKDYHKGVIGIVASRLIEHHYKPTIVFAEKNGILTGSARSIAGFDMFQGLSQCEKHISQFGGHYYAAGLSLPIENFEGFCETFEQVVRENYKNKLPIEILEYDIDCQLEDINENVYKSLERFGPFGPENLRPIFVSRGVSDTGMAQILGNEDKKHLKMNVISPTGKIFGAIGFGLGHYYSQLQVGKTFDIAYQVEMNHFNGKSTLQLMVKDMKFQKN